MKILLVFALVLWGFERRTAAFTFMTKNRKASEKASISSSDSKQVSIDRRDNDTNTNNPSSNNNGRGKKIRRNERVVFFPSSAYQNSEKQWVVPIHGWIFNAERHSSLRRRALLALLRSAFKPKLQGEDDNEEDNNGTSDANTEVQVLQQAKNTTQEKAKAILARRVHPFIVDNRRRRTMTIRLLANSDIVRELPERSRKNGHFQTNLVFEQEELAKVLESRGREGNNKLEFEAVTGIEDDQRSFRGSSQLVPPTGLSVISDIDDTVKVSDVMDMKRLVRHTFLEEFSAVPGIPELYQSWRQEHGASFHYVSSSPWQLYEELADFFEREGFPDAACFHLKSIRLKDRTVLNLFEDPMQSKISKISSILDSYPQRQFVMVGDTGERDPEVYGEICRMYPHQIQKVFLRDVTSDLSDEIVASMNRKNEKRKTGIVVNGPDRYELAFRGVPSNVWSVFREATEIQL